MDEFFFGYIAGIITIIFVAAIASTGAPDKWNATEIELACRQEFNQQVASNSADMCPPMVARLKGDK